MLNEVVRAGGRSYKIHVLTRRETRELSCSPSVPRGAMARRRPAICSQEAGSPQERTLPDLNLGPSSFQNYEEVNFSCVSHVVHGTLLQWSKLTRAPW